MFDKVAYQREYQQRQLAANPVEERTRRRKYATKYRENNREKTREASRKYRAKLKASDNKRVLAERDHAGGLWRNYRMTPEQYAEMLAAQNGVCAFCFKTDHRRLCVDHDHTKPKGEGNRWLLCSACNTMIGHGKDNSALLRLAAAKLDEYNGRVCDSIRFGERGEGVVIGPGSPLSLPG